VDIRHKKYGKLTSHLLIVTKISDKNRSQDYKTAGSLLRIVDASPGTWSY
jgi:hypothetical protein